MSVHRKYRINFVASTQDELPWSFTPTQSQLIVNAGETALVFYKVHNRSDKPIAGIAVYGIYPEEVALYFNKI